MRLAANTPPFPPEFPPERPRRQPPGHPQRERVDEPSPGRAGLLADRLLALRVVQVDGPLDGGRAADVSARLLTLQAAGDEPVTVLLRAPDGELEASFAVADTVGALRCPVHVVVAGRTGGPPLAVLAAGRTRRIMPHATLWLAEPRAHAEGVAGEVAALEQDHRRLTEALYARLAEVSGREITEVREDARTGRMFSAAEALAYGLVEAVATSPTSGF